MPGIEVSDAELAAVVIERDGPWRMELTHRAAAIKAKNLTVQLIFAKLLKHARKRRVHHGGDVVGVHRTRTRIVGCARPLRNPYTPVYLERAHCSAPSQAGKPVLPSARSVCNTPRTRRSIEASG